MLDTSGETHFLQRRSRNLSSLLAHRDAALASVICLQRAIGGRAPAMPFLQELLQTDNDNPLSVVELGAGCGMVGIALAELRPQCSVLLTDLPEVHDIVARNIASASPARRSAIGFRTLDWDEEHPEAVCSGEIDLILVSDCTYNADRIPSLVRVLDVLVRGSPDAVVLVALKRRHESEAVFFDLMAAAAFGTLDRDTVPLPSSCVREDPPAESIEVYVFGRRGRADPERGGERRATHRRADVDVSTLLCA